MEKNNPTPDEILDEMDTESNVDTQSPDTAGEEPEVEEDEDELDEEPAEEEVN